MKPAPRIHRTVARALFGDNTGRTRSYHHDGSDDPDKAPAWRARHEARIRAEEARVQAELRRLRKRGAL